jgi:hypothetical protein
MQGQSALGQHDPAPLEGVSRTRCRSNTADLGSVAAIGRFHAICSVRKLHQWRGLGRGMFVHLAFLSGVGNRFTTMLRWLRWLLGGTASSACSAGPHR